ncbi:MAG TPA: phosphodiester glycosidase family protein [Candidatus Hydrogenedentes bacterium]|nr:phosphodiester glycosidase family protein [Candidatus Hydrogenedentota bacterium]HOH52493.1 phosphodiester glycosidase family protein [Candidatus Hydrogenedentota bacterium]HRZ84406.1 phosphodiester glycosidase family protein [Candidatus Hydrogenedentota bacterium]
MKRFLPPLVLLLLVPGTLWAPGDLVPVYPSGVVWVVDSASSKGVRYLTVRVPLDTADLALHWKREDGTPLCHFHALRDYLSGQGRHLVFAANAGIYARDYTPLGLHVENGREMEPLNRKQGGGNFFLKPNGVFFVKDRKGRVMETEAYAALNMKPDLAVQSGPLLLSNGEIHPRFLPDSDSLYIRSGVGMRSETEAMFVLSLSPVNFNDFALFFRDELKCRDALYLDGALSDFYTSDMGRTGPGGLYVGMLSVSVPDSSGKDVQK